MRRLLLVALLVTTVFSVALSVNTSSRASGINCSDFASQQAAQAFLNANPSDPEGLDGNHNGWACETTFGHVSTPTGTVKYVSGFPHYPDYPGRPKPTPTPKPTLGIAYIGGTAKAAGTNCRSSASFSGGVIVLLKEGAKVTTRGASSNGWTPIQCNGKNGFVSSQYLKSSPPKPTTTPTPTLGTAYVSGTPKAGGTNCRTSASFSGGVIVLLKEGTKVTTRGASSNGWTPVQCNGKNGFVSTSYLKSTPPKPAPTPTPQPAVTAYIAHTPNAGGTNCRTSASFSGGVISLLVEGTKVTTRGASSNGWTPVTCSGKAGYVSTNYLSSTKPAAAKTSPTATPTSTSTNVPTAIPTSTPILLTPTSVPAQLPTQVPSPTVQPTDVVVPTEEVVPTETPPSPESPATIEVIETPEVTPTPSEP